MKEEARPGARARGGAARALMEGLETRPVPFALAVLFALATSVGLFDSTASALVFAAALLAFVLPGVAVARRWFHGLSGRLAGVALGYWLSSLLASALHRLEWASPGLLVAVPGLLGASLLWALPRRPGERNAGASSHAELAWLGALWLFVSASVALPFLRVGESVSGGVAFRAYFSADLMTHLSVVAELQKGVFPLENPFYAGEPLAYYWLFFAFPAAVGAWTSNQGALLTLYLAGGLLFSGLLFGVGRELGLRPGRAFLLAAIAVGAASYDGVVALGRSLAGAESFTDANVDAMGRWVFELVSLDGLHRSILYTPQHLFSYSLLLALVLVLLRGEPRSRGTLLLAGSLLGGMAGASIVTAMIAGPWTVLVLWRRRESAASFLRSAAAIAAVALAHLAWFFELGFFGGAGGELSVRLPRWLELPSLLAIDAGALVLLLLLRAAGGSGSRTPARSAAPPAFTGELLLLAGLSLAAVLFLDLRSYEGVWMAWRAGSVLLVSLSLLAAPAVASLRPRHAAFVLPAALTLVLDVWNAQDVSNRRPSPGGFPWTTVVPDDEWEALRFLRESTAETARVQWDVRARHPGEWALLPAVAERRMAVGFPIFLLDPAKYRVRERRHVRPIFTGADAGGAHELATALGIDYLVVGEAELRARGDRVRALFEAGALFRPVFESGEVAVLLVLP